MIIEKVSVGMLQANCYVIGCEETNKGVVIDPGGEASRISDILDRHGLKLEKIIGTHAHFDHVLAVSDLKKAKDVPFYLHRDDLPLLEELQDRGRRFLGISLPNPPEVDEFLEEGDEVPFGEERLQVLHTPGHSRGGISLFNGSDSVFVGDLLFNGSIGRVDKPEGSYDALIEAVETKIFPLGDDVTVYPGHGPNTTVGRERRTNPFFAGR